MHPRSYHRLSKVHTYFIKIIFGRHRGWLPFCDSDEGVKYTPIKCLEIRKRGKEFLNKM
jgi:hypothetical protein